MGSEMCIRDSNEENVENLTAARFRNEILTTYELQHPNVVRSLGYQREGDMLGLILEYLPFGSLRDLIESEQRVETGEILYLIDNVLKGLSAVHAAGIIHRDLRPENILFGKDGRIKISDFGDARVGATISSGQGITGKLDYLSPEYIKEGNLTEASDIYSLGIGLYELITRTNPFKAESPIRALAKRLTEKITPPHELIPGFPEALSNFVVKALATDPDERFKTAHEMIQHNNMLAQHLGITFESLSPEFPPEIPGAIPFDELDASTESSASLPTIDFSASTEKKSSRTATKSSFANKVFPEKNWAPSDLKLWQKLGIGVLAVLFGLVIASLFSTGEEQSLASQETPQAEEDSPSQAYKIPTGWYVLYLRHTDPHYVSNIADNLSASDYRIQVQTELNGGSAYFNILIGPYENEPAANATLFHIQSSEEGQEGLELKYFN